MNLRGASMPASKGNTKKMAKKLEPKLQGAFKKKRGANSNHYLNKILNGEIEITDDNINDVSMAIKDSHRVKPVKKSKASQGRSVFNAQTGHHEWLPTDRAAQIITNGNIWPQLYSNLRSPTWLLMLNPEKYCKDIDSYKKSIKGLAASLIAKQPFTIKASSLGLVGHSGGLNFQGTQLTTHQPTWHDKLRGIYEDYADNDDYQQYFTDLLAFTDEHFLFKNAITLPMPGVDTNKVSAEEVMKHIEWDLQLSGRGNPDDVKIETLYDVAVYLNSSWSVWGQTLTNSFTATVG